MTAVKTVSAAARMRREVLKVYEKHVQRGELPTSNRFIFYEMAQLHARAGYPVWWLRHSSTGRYDPAVEQALTYWREQGMIPWEHLVDETRSLNDYTGYPSVRDGLLWKVPQVRLDPWDDEPPMIITESRSLAGVLRGTAARYCTRIAATNGQASGSQLHNDLAPALYPGARVIYIGDLDMAGGKIEASTRKRLEDILGGKLNWGQRLAITKTQVDLYDILPRSKKYGGVKHDAYETEALNQGVLVQLLIDELDALLPEPLDDVLEREQQEQADIKAELQAAR
jgi:hypothetical protein